MSSQSLFTSEHRQAMQLVDYVIKGTPYCCDCMHPDMNCFSRIFYATLKTFWALFKINFPIHIIPALIFKRKILKKQPSQELKKLLKNIIKSVMFLTSFIFMIKTFQCALYPIMKKIAKDPVLATNTFSCLFPGMGIAFEQAHRRAEITYYCLPRTFEGILSYLQRRKLMIEIPYQEQLTYMVAWGILALCYRDGKTIKTIKGFTLTTCKNLLADI